jgi:replicative DNA helicase
MINNEAERQVIGALIDSPELITKVQGILNDDDFLSQEARLVFQAIKKLGVEADVFTLAEKTAICITELSDLNVGCANSGNALAYSKLLKKESAKFKLIQLSNDIQEAIRQGSEPIDVISDVSGRLSDLSRSGGRKTQFTLGQATKALVDDMDERAEGRGMVYDTGIAELNDKMPFEGGKLYLIGGQSGMGKTTVAQKFIEVQALTKVPVFFSSIEMKATEVAKRMVQSAGSVPGKVFKRPDKEIANYSSQLSAGINLIKDHNVLIDEDSNVGAQDIILRARAWLNQQQVYQDDERGCLFVDYVQLMNYNRSNEVQELAAITKALKSFAKEMNIPVIALVQLNREYLKRPASERRPIVKDIKGSSGMEADSDGIILCHREEYYDEDTPDKGILELIIGKARDGKTGTVRTLGEMEYFRVRDIKTQFESQAH